MNESFDPYHRWLGIAPEEQPANHYRLLGLKQFESDADVIESAADRQMAHVRGFQSGQHAAAAQQVLNEISKAKLVLLKPEERAKYESQLKAQSGPKVREPKLAQALPLPAATQTAALPAAPPPKRPAPKSAVVSSVPTKSGGPNIALLVAVPAVIFLILVGGTLAYLVFPRGEVEGVARNDSPNPPTLITVPPVVTPADNQRPQPEPIEEPTPEPKVVTSPQESVIDEPPDITEPEPPVPSDPIEPSLPDDGEFIAAAPEAQPPENTGPRKNPVPDKAARDAARVKIDAIFSIEDADTREKKAELAQQLLKIAGDTKDDSVAQFVLLNMARELAADNAQARLAMQAVDQLQANFDFDTSAVRMATLGLAVKSPFPPTEKHEVLAVGIEMIDAMLQRDEYEAAGQLAVALLDIARRARNKELLDALTDRRTRAGDLLAEYKKMDPAFVTLKTDPENGDANLLVGRYLTFVKQDWERGLPHLSKGSDGLLAAAAKAELESPPEPDAQLLAANAWWAAAEAEKDKQARLVCLSQSGHWYREAVDKLTGLNKAQAQQRLGEITSQLAGATVAARPDPRPPRKPQGPAIAKITVKEMQTGPLVIKEGMPAELNGATTFDWTPSAKKGNAVEFTVDESGLLIMITSFPETKYEGNNSGGWYESRLTRKQLVEGGWREVAKCTWAPGYFMYARAVEKGQSYRIHTNKYGTPRLILPRSDQDPPPEVVDEPDLGVFSRPPTGLGTPPKIVVPRDEPDGLVAHWTFDEGQGAVARDAAGRHHGIIKAGAWTEGVHGKALHFGKQGGYVSIPDSPAFDEASRLSIAVWIKADDVLDSGMENVVTHLVSGSTWEELRLVRFVDGDGPSYLGGFSKRGGGADKPMAKIPREDEAAWVHLAMTHDGKAWRIFRNGVLAAQADSTMARFSFNGQWLIGGFTDGRRLFQGDIDDVRIYNRALSAEEVTKLAAENTR